MPDAEAPRAILVDLYQPQAGWLVGVALVAPSQRYALRLDMESSGFKNPLLSEAQWHDIEQWIAIADQQLPARPATMPIAVLPAFTSTDPLRSLEGRRCASVPLARSPRVTLAEAAQQMLASVLRDRVSKLRKRLQLETLN